LGLAACAQPVSGEVIKSDKERVSTPDVSQTDLTTLVAGNSDFAFGLYQVLKNTDGNLFYSPHSISLALAMTYAGAATTLSCSRDTTGASIGDHVLEAVASTVPDETETADNSMTATVSVKEKPAGNAGNTNQWRQYGRSV